MEETPKMLKGKTKLGRKNPPPEEKNIQQEVVINNINIEGQNEEPIEKEMIISSYGTFNDNGPLKIRIKKGKEMKNTAKFLMNTILKMYYICLWKNKIKSMKYAQKGYNAQRANLKIFIRNLSTAINNSQYNYLNEIFEKMKKNKMPSGIKHNSNYGKLKIVDNDLMDKKCIDKLLLWSAILPNEKGKQITKLLITTFTKMSKNKNPKISNNSNIYIKPKNVRNDSNNKIKNNYINTNYSNYIYNQSIPKNEEKRYNYYFSPDNQRVLRRSPLLDKTRDIINKVRVINRISRRPYSNYYITPEEKYEYENIPTQTQFSNNYIYINKPRRRNIGYANQLRNSTYEMSASPYKYQNSVVSNNQKIRDNYRFYESQHFGNNNYYQKLNELKQAPRKIKLIKYISRGKPNEYLSPNPKNPYLLQFRNSENEELAYNKKNISPYQLRRNIYGNRVGNYANFANNFKNNYVNRYYVIDEDDEIGRTIPTRCEKCGGIIVDNYRYNNNFGETYSNFRPNRCYQSSIEPENRYNDTYYCYDYLHN